MKTNSRPLFFIGLLLAVLILVGLIFSPFLITISVAATMAVIFRPIYRYVLKWVKYEWLAALIVLLLTIIVVLLPLVLIGIRIAQQASTAYAQIVQESPSLVTDLLTRVENILEQYIPALSLNLTQYAGEGLKWVGRNLQPIFAGTIGTAVQLFLGLIAYYYMLKDGHRFVESLSSYSPLKQSDNNRILDRLRTAVESVIRGSIIIALLQGFVTGVGLVIFGVPNAILFGSIAGVGALIPTVGTGIVLVPVIGYLFLTNDLVSAIGLTIWGTVAVGTIDNFLHPILVGAGLRLHPFFVLFSVIGGIAVFGIAGFILGPLTISLLFALLDIFREELSESS